MLNTLRLKWISRFLGWRQRLYGFCVPAFFAGNLVPPLTVLVGWLRG